MKVEALVAVLLSMGAGASCQLRAAPGDTCWYPNYICSINVPADTKTIDTDANPTFVDQTLDCYNQCSAAGAGNCDYFTIWSFQGKSTCYFLTSCDEEYDKQCSKSGTCKSGPTDCGSITNDNANCPPIDPDNTPSGNIHWQCIDIESNSFNGYTVQDIQAGSQCVLRCESWEDTSGEAAHLVSTCQNDGTWSPTIASNEATSGAELEFPPYPADTGIYPTPDQMQTFGCGCKDLHVEWATDFTNLDTFFYYDPNTEPGTEFICEQSINQSQGTYIITTENKCILFCDSYLVADVRCLNGEWTGQPELGFWCYTQPHPDNEITTPTPDTTT